MAEEELAVQAGLKWVQDWTADRFTLEYGLAEEVVEKLKEVDCWPWVESEEWLT
jgi:hypothetical protein